MERVQSSHRLSSHGVSLGTCYGDVALLQQYFPLHLSSTGSKGKHSNTRRDGLVAEAADGDFSIPPPERLHSCFLSGLLL